MVVLLRVLPLIVLGAFIGPAQQRGTVTNVTLSPSPVDARTPVTATATGTNPCGAVFIDWGDGTAITYPISSVPATATHTYAGGGRFTVLAKGMGNCDGEVKTALVVTGPPAPPAPGPPAITSVDITPSPAAVRRPVEIAVKGAGSCSFSVDFGDGNSSERTGALPQTVTHTYTIADSYVVIVRPVPPCAGRFTQKLTVGTEPQQPQITGLTVSPERPIAGQPVTIDVLGSGTCSYRIDFGDGNDETRTRQMPDRVRHNYPAPDRYIIAVTAEPPCSGSARSTLIIRPRR